MPGRTHRIGPSLIDTAKAFATEENCHAYLEAARWPSGVRCMKCNSDKISKFTVKGKTRIKKNGELQTGPDRLMYQCLNSECKYQFQTTTGTIFGDTHLPLSKWMLAVAIMCNAKKGVSAKQMERDLGVSYKTAWYLCHRIRKAMEDGEPGMLTGTVEMDETYVGAKRRDKRTKTILPYGKMPVFGMMQRGTNDEPSKVFTKHVKAVNMKQITGIVDSNLSPSAKLVVTDEAKIYRRMGERVQHETVNHIRMEYVRKGDPRSIHTNTIENFWSLFKRGVIGSYHKVSMKHLRRYLDEFTFRFNNRQDEDIFAAVVLNLVIAAGIRYEDLTSNPDGAGETELFPYSL